jgi:hypothetical protein
VAEDEKIGTNPSQGTYLSRNVGAKAEVNGTEQISHNPGWQGGTSGRHFAVLQDALASKRRGSLSRPPPQVE